MADHIPSNIPQSVVNAARNQFNQGDVAGAWNTLAQAGDRYADNAAGVLGANRDAADSFFRELVKNHWENTVGTDVYNNKFDDVAKEHLDNYLKQLEDGWIPSTQDIIDSYEKALTDNGVSRDAAFDGAWSKALPGDSFDGSWGIPFLGMEPERLTTSETHNDLSPSDARGLLGRDFTETVKKFWDDGRLGDLTDAFNKRFQEGKADYWNDLFKKVDKWFNDPKNVNNSVRDAWNWAKQWFPRRDPLTFDLDGDGLETIGVSATNPILFDHNGDGIKTGTGWVLPDDGFLVLDKNSNGVIDNGTELFGDSTVKSNGQKATDGFDALADLDSAANGGNGDGIVNASDAQFANLKIWRDLNQDGISQSNELFTLSSLNIAGINVGVTQQSQTLANGNQIADKGTFIKTDGSQGQMGEVSGNMADINLAEDTFHRSFTDTLDTTSVATLPDMQGSGKVRDLREAATQSATLQTLLTQYSQATTRAAQMALIDQLLDAWADTGGMAESMTQRVAGMTGYTKADGTVIPYTLQYNAFGNTFNYYGSNYSPEFAAKIAEWSQKLHIIETFNGSYFFGLPGTSQTQGAVSGISMTTPDANSSNVQIAVSFSQQQLDLMQQSYDAIKTSVYDALLLQTRFKSMLDQVNLVIDTNGISLDFSQLDATFDAEIAANPTTGLLDLIDFNAATNDMLNGTSWDGWGKLRHTLLTTTPSQEIGEAINFHKIQAYLLSTSGDDVLLGDGGNNQLNGGAGNDILYGWGGNDYLQGGDGADTYIFGRGYGQDYIWNVDNDGLGINADTLRINPDVAPTDVSLKRNGNDLIVSINGTTDSVTIQSYFYQDGTSNYGYAVENIAFADGTNWDINTVKAKVLVPTEGNDNIQGYASNDTLNGAGGNDTLNGGAGDDVINGGAGNDFLSGGDGADTYRFGRGAGQDTINNYDNDALGVNADQILFDAGVSPSDVTLTRDTYSNNLYISIKGTTDSINVNNFFYQDGVSSYAVDSIKFADGTTWDIATIKAKAILGTTGDDILRGYATGDTLDGGAGNDYLQGNNGADTYVFGRGYGQDTIYNYDTDPAGTSPDKVTLGSGIAVSDVVLSRDQYSNDLHLGISGTTDMLNLYGYFTQDGASSYAVETIQFKDGTVWDVSTIKQKLLTGTSGNDAMRGYATNDVMSGGAGADTIYGADGNDALNGEAGNDIINGDNGNDTLDGGAGNDTLYGGAGSDTYLFGRGSGQDTIYNYDGDAVDVNPDKVLFGTGVAIADVALTRSADDLQLAIAGTNDVLTIKNYFSQDGTSNAAVESIQFADGTSWDVATVKSKLLGGTNGDDLITGFTTNDLLTGGAGNDTLNGGDGDDTLVGGVGNDVLTGGTGADVYRFGFGDGQDRIYNTAADNATVTDILALGAGITLDSLSFNHINNDLVIKVGASDSVTVVDYYASGVSNKVGKISQGDGTILTPSDIEARVGRPTAWDDWIVGSGVDETIHALGGNDTVFGGDGNDQLFGDAGNDTLNGDNGNDTLDGGIGTDSLYGGAGDDTYFVDQTTDLVVEYDSNGIDTVNTSVNYTLSANVENLNLLTGALAGTGNALANKIVGNSGANTLDGGAGIDTLVGGSGDDVYYVDQTNDVVTENLNEGTDTVIASTSYTLAANLENLTLAETYNANNGTGNDLANLITGNNQYNLLVGAGGDDTLVGGGGNDTLDGGSGNDVLNGGSGDDTYIIDAGDQIVEVANNGNDTVVVGYSYDLSTVSEIENITLSGNANINATGNDVNNTLTGNAGNNQLDGGLGADYLSGWGGDDTYYTNEQGDTIYEAGNDGIDTEIRSFESSYLLTNNVENLTLTGTIYRGNGNELDNVITGNDADNNLYGLGGNDTLIGGAGNDVLFGADGADMLIGGAGDDYYEIDNVADTIVEAANEGDDFVRSTVSWTLGANVERLALDGSNDLTATGNALDNGLWGNQGNNTLTGGLGSDFLSGDAGDDVYVFNKGDGQDTIDNTDILTAIDTLRFGAGITDNDVLAFQSGNNIFFKIKGTTDQIAFVDYYAANTLSGDGQAQDHKIDRIEFANGVVWDQAMIQTVVDRANNNHSPTVNTFLPTLQAKANSLFTYTVAANTITDPDVWDSITYSIKMQDGSAVPAWLTFDPVTRVISGTPALGNVGSLQFVLWGTDNYGYSAGEFVTINVAAPNRAPVLSSALLDQSAYQGGVFTYTVPSAAFTDPDAGDSLTYSATLADGSALPSWLTFNSSTRVFSGTPPTAGTISVKVTAKDTGNLTASDVFDIVTTLQNLTINGTSAAETLNGAGGNDVINGNAGNDVLNGLAGNDTLDGGAGNDTMVGGTGNDTYTVDSATDVITENTNEGTDSVNVAIATASGTYTLGANVENGTLTNTVAFTLTGNALDNVLIGNAAANTINGGDGNDTIDGGAGTDSMAGGLGNDVYTIDATTDVVTEAASAGTDTVNVNIATAGGAYTVAANVENATLINTVAYNLTGNALNNVLTGNAANNVLDGGAGNDTMIGGVGNDTYTIDATTDVITENLNEGTDSVNVAIATASGSYTLAANVENATLTNTVAFTLTGNALDNVLTGNAAANTINGGDGNDTIDGGAGNDSMAGGLGNDTYTIDATTDVITENLNEGTDSVNVAIATASGSYTLAANVENATLTNTVAFTLTGNALDNVLTGNAAANTINGGAGNDIIDGGAGTDSMVGGAGDDTYTIDATTDVITENANEGTDTVKVNIATASGTYTVGTNLENATLINTVAYNLTGNASNNVLTGNAANNVIDGGAANDTMIGGAGNDTYTVDSVSDVVTENLNEGTDSVNVAVATAGLTYTLAANVENATLTNTVAFTLTGNALDNTLTGNAAANTINGGDGNDTINGGAGNDSMAGGLGNDTYTIDSTSDVITENLNEGTDSVNVAIATASGSYTLAANVENATLTNTVAFTLTGNALDNVLIGNAAANTINGGDGNDTIDGGAGNDSMAGGLGNDVYTVDSASDVVTEAASAGTDTVKVAIATASGTYTLGANIENGTLTNTVAFTLTGNALDNVLIGNAAANTINGGDGNDTIDGGAGTDSMAGGLGNDVYTIDATTDVVTEAASAGTDTVNVNIATASGTYTLGTNIENAALINTVAYNLTGNVLANYMLGNAANNTLTDTVAGGANDILQGMAGADTLNHNAASNSLLDGGIGNDTITGGAGKEIIIGGQGNDTITTGTGADVIVFNKGDGQDIIAASTGTDNTLSLGGNFAYSDLSLTKSGTDLILKMGTTDQITFSGWYATTANQKSVLNLQVIAEAIQGFSQGGADTLRNDKIENFNFQNLVAAFDAAGSPAAWQLTDARLTAQLLTGSNSAAIGGDIAYQYGKNSNLTGIGLLAAQNVINNASLGVAAQTLNAPSTWTAETTKLS